MLSLQSAKLISGKGIVGDRYYSGKGTFSPPLADPDHEVTLIELEQVELFNKATGHLVEAGAFRRNIVTHGAVLNELAGCDFSLGTVRLRGIRLCEPCPYLGRMTHPEVLPRLLQRGGLRAGILSDGLLRVGDPLSAIQRR